MLLETTEVGTTMSRAVSPGVAQHVLSSGRRGSHGRWSALVAVAALTLSGLGASAIADPTTDASGASGAASGSATTTQEAAQTITPLAATFGSFICQPGYIYSVQSSGQIKQVSPAGDVSTTVSSQSSNGAANGLGINADGSIAYWYNRSNDFDKITSVVRYQNSTPTTLPNSDLSLQVGTASFVAGAVDPTTGKLLAGKIANQAVSLWAFDGTTWKALGTASNSKLPSSSLNGDMAFDAAGNLYVVSSTDPDRRDYVTVNITVIKAADIVAAVAANDPSRRIRAQNVITKTIKANSGFNGIAFDSNGYVYVGNSTTLLKYDPTTWAQIGGRVTASLDDSTDLSSCSTPPTLEVDKVLPTGRYNSTDQFTLAIADSSGTTSTTATTTGSTSGLQPDSAGPGPVIAGNTYSVSEVGANTSTDLANYTSSLVCIDQANGNASVLVNNGKLTIPSGKANTSRVVCTFTNIAKAKLGSLTWTKTDADGNALAGSEWRLTGPSPVTTSVTVTDNTGQTGYLGLDTNTAAGAFTVGNLTAGTYTLAETKAPQGYVLNSTPMTVTVTAGGIASAGQIKNTAVTGNVEWSKVGDLGGDDLISGTSWTITPTDPAGAAITVTDNGTNDADSTFGKFLVKNLRYGTYTLKETAAPAGFELNETAYSFTISDDGKTVGVNDSKPIVDARTKGVVTWTKVDGSHNKLSGSEWTITPTGGGSPITVTDNTGQSGYTGADRDATTGAFEVDNLAWGDYTLTETKAPAGYKLDDSSHQFTISGTQLQVPVGEIVNEQQTPPSLPLTGGVGTDSFLIGGGALLALAGFGGFLRRRRTLRTARA